MASTLDPAFHPSRLEQAIVGLEWDLSVAEGCARGGCERCRIDAIAISSTLGWIRALREFQRGMFPELQPAEPGAATSEP